jgi:L-seryl-tRNA(Ser) seleniumtransferase
VDPINDGEGESVWKRFGTRPVINACGIYTDLGGSRLSPTVWRAMTEANQQFVRMGDLLAATGEVLAKRLGAEAGLVTTGAAASITLMVSAAMTGPDGAASERLPDTTGLRNEIILQSNHRYKYDRQISLTGARVVLAGTEAGTGEAELEAALSDRTAALYFPAHLDGAGNTVALVSAAALARRHRLPLLIDAAYWCWPLELMPELARHGDLVCFSAKYFGGPNAGGFIVGRRELLSAVRANNFLNYESGRYRTFGRPLKIDRQTVVGVVTAFEEWLDLDHRARWARYARQVETLRAMLANPAGFRTEPRCFTMDERLVPEPVNALVVEFEAAGRLTASVVADRLASGNPSIACVREATRLIFCVDLTSDEEVVTIGEQLIRILGSPAPR